MLGASQDAPCEDPASGTALGIDLAPKPTAQGSAEPI